MIQNLNWLTPESVHQDAVASAKNKLRYSRIESNGWDVKRMGVTDVEMVLSDQKRVFPFLDYIDEHDLRDKAWAFVEEDNQDIRKDFENFESQNGQSEISLGESKDLIKLFLMTEEAVIEIMVMGKAERFDCQKERKTGALLRSAFLRWANVRDLLDEDLDEISVAKIYFEYQKATKAELNLRQALKDYEFWNEI